MAERIVEGPPQFPKHVTGAAGASTFFLVLWRVLEDQGLSIYLSETGFTVSEHRLTIITLLTLIATLL